jgi:hypothetical protein
MIGEFNTANISPAAIARESVSKDADLAVEQQLREPDIGGRQAVHQYFKKSTVKLMAAVLRGLRQ